MLVEIENGKISENNKNLKNQKVLGFPGESKEKPGAIQTDKRKEQQRERITNYWKERKEK